MLTMTSLNAQRYFGALTDTSQRQPVTVTRRGRPVAVMLSYEYYIQLSKTIPYEVAKMISANFPLQGKEAAASLKTHLASMENQAATEGLTEEALTQMLNEK